VAQRCAVVCGAGVRAGKRRSACCVKHRLSSRLSHRATAVFAAFAASRSPRLPGFCLPRCFLHASPLFATRSDACYAQRLRRRYVYAICHASVAAMLFTPPPCIRDTPCRAAPLCAMLRALRLRRAKRMSYGAVAARCRWQHKSMLHAPLQVRDAAQRLRRMQKRQIAV